MGLMMMVGVFPALFLGGSKGLNHHPTDSCEFGGTRNRTLTTHAQVSGEKGLITDPLILLILQPRKKKSPSQIIEISLDGLVVLMQYHLLYPLHSTICWSISNHYYCHQGKMGGCCPSLSHAKSWATTS